MNLHHLRRPQVSFRSPEGEKALRPPWSDLEAQAKLAGLVGTHAPEGNSARKTESKKERHGGISLSGN